MPSVTIKSTMLSVIMECRYAMCSMLIAIVNVLQPTHSLITFHTLFGFENVNPSLFDFLLSGREGGGIKMFILDCFMLSLAEIRSYNSFFYDCIYFYS